MVRSVERRMVRVARRILRRVPFLRRLVWGPAVDDRIQGDIPDGQAGIDEVGHRRYVGPAWEEIGQLQFDFLMAQGLQPHHTLLDIACGSLRGGVRFIPYLEVGHYLGIDKEEGLIQAGIEKELGPDLERTKQPRFVVSDAFAFDQFAATPDYAIAQSLFTHLPPDMIVDCMSKLRRIIADEGVFLATFFETAKPRKNPSKTDGHGFFAYTRAEMEAFGVDTGWRSEYIGDWEHPRGQVMVKYHPLT